jgi:hypothetical protein
LSLVLLRLRLLLKSWNGINHQMLIKFWHNWSEQEVKYYIRRSTNLLILFQIRRSCQISGRHLVLNLLIRRVIKLILIIIEEYHFYQLHTTFYPTFILLPELTPKIHKIVWNRLHGL